MSEVTSHTSVGASNRGPLARLRRLHGLPALAVSSLVLTVISQANIGRIVFASKQALIDMQTALSWAGFLDVLAAWTPADFAAYWGHYGPDLVHPFVYGMAGATVMGWILQRRRHTDRLNGLMLLVPVAGALDLVENTCHAVTISSYPAVPYWTFAVGNPAAVLKWTLVVIALGAAVLLGLVIKGRQSPPGVADPTPPQGAELPDITGELKAHAQERPDTVALRFPKGPTSGAGWHALTYATLDEQTERFARNCIALGLRRGDPVLLLFKPTAAFYPVCFGLLRAGLVPVFIDPSMGLKRAFECVRTIQPRAMVAPPVLHWASLVLRRVFRSIEFGIVAGRRGWGFGPTVTRLTEGDAPAVNFGGMGAAEDACIIFTSGATGPPKAVVLSRACLHARIQSVISLLGAPRGTPVVETLLIYTLMWLIGGLRITMPEMDVTRPAKTDPEALIDALQRFEPAVASASLIVWQRLVRYAEGKDLHFPSVETLITSSAPIPAGLHGRLRAVVNDGVQLNTPYGSTEAMPVTNVVSETLLAGPAEETAQGAGICLGRPVPGAEVRVIAHVEGPLPTWAEVTVQPAGEMGEVVVAGQVVSDAYRSAPGANEASKIRDGERRWHRMGDLGYFDDAGRLWFCGRCAHRIETAQGIVPAVPLEQIYVTHPAVFRAALVGVGPMGRQRPVLCVELEAGQRWSDTLAQAVLALADGTRWAGRVETAVCHPGLPTDARHNSKIMRPTVAAWAVAQGL